VKKLVIFTLLLLIGMVFINGLIEMDKPSALPVVKEWTEVENKQTVPENTVQLISEEEPGLLPLNHDLPTTRQKHLGEYVPSELLVRFKPEVTASQKEAFVAQLGATVKQRFEKMNLEQWVLPEGVSVADTLKKIEGHSLIEMVEPNYRRSLYALPNDPLVTSQWQHKAMGLPSVWQTTTGSKNVVIAVIDDSIDTIHPDLQSNIWTNPREIPANGIDDDFNGYIDDVHGWDLLNNDNNTGADNSSEGHGTWVAGCIGAVGGNGLYVTGVNWNVSIMPLKFGMNIASELAAFQYAIDNGAHIVNASWGGVKFSFAELGGILALKNAGILLVAAAGNGGTDNDQMPDYPSGYDLPNILTVAATDKPVSATVAGPDTLPPSTQFGQASVDVAAPGVAILTTQSKSGISDMMGSWATEIGYVSGTSFSAPHVAGIAALLKSRFPAASFQDIKGRIMAGVTPLNNNHIGKLTTDGAVNAMNAMTVVPQPVITFKSYSVDDGLAGNGILDPGETVNLNIVLENSWAMASGVSASISSNDPNVTVNVQKSGFPMIGPGANATSTLPFNITLGNVAGYRRVMFQMNIIATGGYAVTRHFSINVGTLVNGKILPGTIQVDEQDRMHDYYIDVPAGMAELKVNASSNATLTTFVKQGSPAKFISSCFYNPNCVEPGAITATNFHLKGNASTIIPKPVAGRYYVSVFKNYQWQLQQSYTVQASYSAIAGIDTTPPSLLFPWESGATWSANQFVDSLNIKSAVAVSSADPRISSFLSSVTANDDVDGTLPVRNNAPGVFPVGTTVVTFRATDRSGNMRLTTAPVTVQRDMIAPVLKSPADMTYPATSAAGVPAAEPKIQRFLSSFMVVSDNFDQWNLITTSNNAPALFPVGVTVVTVTATDSAGNSSSATANVTVVDVSTDIFPTAGDIQKQYVGMDSWQVATDFFTEGASSLKSNNGQSFTLLGNGSPGVISFDLRVDSEKDFDNLVFEIDGVEQGRWSGLVNWLSVSYPVTAGRHTFSWKYYKDAVIDVGMDAAWIDNIRVPIDTVPPVITLYGPVRYVVPLGGLYIDQGAGAFDLGDGDITAGIVVNNPVNTAIPNTYIITYDVSDSAGNAAHAIRTVIVRNPECVQRGIVDQVTVRPGGANSTIYVRKSVTSRVRKTFTTRDEKLLKAAVKSLPGRTYVEVKGNRDCTTATNGGAAQYVDVAP